MADAAEARLREDPDGRALFAEPIAVVQRVLTRRVAAAGGRDETRIGLEKIEALAGRLRDAVAERRPLAVNVGGALVSLTAKGRLDFVAEPARRAASAAGLRPRRDTNPSSASERKRAPRSTGAIRRTAVQADVANAGGRHAFAQPGRNRIRSTREQTTGRRTCCGESIRSWTRICFMRCAAWAMATRSPSSTPISLRPRPPRRPSPASRFS